MELDEDEENESSDTVDGEEASELHLENNSNRLVDHSFKLNNVNIDVHFGIACVFTSIEKELSRVKGSFV